MLSGQSDNSTAYDFNRLVTYTTWANDTWIQFLSDHQITDTDLLKRMSHIILAERVWFQRIDGEDPDRNIWQVLSISSLKEFSARHRQTYTLLLDGDIERTISYKKFAGEEYQSTVEDILMHLMFHGVHHRGQMATIASSTGFKPVNTGFIQFCRKHS